MFGPLPKLHRLLVVTAGLLIGLVTGVWLVNMTAVPALVFAGVGWGLLAGLLLILVLLHDFHHGQRAIRVRRD
ncbi:MAG: hypothetical protein WBP61_17685 [Nocardioides sp.]